MSFTVGATLAARIWDAYADRYDALFYDPVARAEDGVVSGWLEDWLQRTAPVHHIVDVGCGTGLGLRLLPPLFPFTYTGVDIAPRMIERAQARHPQQRWVVGDANHLTDHLHYPATHVISTYGSLVYVAQGQEPAQALIQIARSLRPGGHWFLMFYAYRRRWTHCAPELPVWVPLAPSGILKALRRAGLRPTRMRGLTLLPWLGARWVALEARVVGRRLAALARYVVVEGVVDG